MASKRQRTKNAGLKFLFILGLGLPNKTKCLVSARMHGNPGTGAHIAFGIALSLVEHRNIMPVAWSKGSWIGSPLMGWQMQMDNSGGLKNTDHGSERARWLVFVWCSMGFYREGTTWLKCMDSKGAKRIQRIWNMQPKVESAAFSSCAVHLQITDLFFWEMKYLRCKMYKEKTNHFSAWADVVPFERMLRSSYFVLLGWNMHIRRLYVNWLFLPCCISETSEVHAAATRGFHSELQILSLRLQLQVTTILQLNNAFWYSVCFCFWPFEKEVCAVPLFQWSLFSTQVCPPTVWPADAPAPGGCGAPSMCFILCACTRLVHSLDNPGYQQLASQDPCSQLRYVAGPVKIVAGESQELARLTHVDFVRWKNHKESLLSFLEARAVLRLSQHLGNSANREIIQQTSSVSRSCNHVMTCHDCPSCLTPRWGYLTCPESVAGPPWRLETATFGPFVHRHFEVAKKYWDITFHCRKFLKIHERIQVWQTYRFYYTQIVFKKLLEYKMHVHVLLGLKFGLIPGKCAGGQGFLAGSRSGRDEAQLTDCLTWIGMFRAWRAKMIYSDLLRLWLQREKKKLPRPHGNTFD